jgi:hypothetical protein
MGRIEPLNGALGLHGLMFAGALGMVRENVRAVGFVCGFSDGYHSVISIGISTSSPSFDAT